MDKISSFKKISGNFESDSKDANFQKDAKSRDANSKGKRRNETFQVISLIN